MATQLLLPLILAVNLTPFWTLRPQLFSLLLLAGMLVILGHAFAGWEGRWQLPWPRRPQDEGAPEATAAEAFRHTRWLWWMPLLFVVWVNTHGAFLAGYCLFAAYLACRSCEAVTRFGLQAVPYVGQWLAVLAVSAAVTLINPYGVEYFQWLAAALGNARPEIVEWRAPDLSTACLPFWGLCVVLAATLIVSRRSYDFTHLFLLLALLVQALEHRRHIVFVVFLFGFWFAHHLDALLVSLSKRRFWKLESRPTRPAVQLGFGLACIFLLVSLIGHLYQQLRMIPVMRDHYPVSAFQYMADHQLQGRLVVEFRWAQYTIMAFGQDRMQLACDGRFRTCYPRWVLDMYFDFDLGNQRPRWRNRDPASPPYDPGRILSMGDPNLVLIDRKHEIAVHEMQRHSADWVLLYQDSLAQLWGRKSLYDDPSVSTYIPPARRSVSEFVQEGFVRWPALPDRASEASQPDEPTPFQES